MKLTLDVTDAKTLLKQAWFVQLQDEVELTQLGNLSTEFVGEEIQVDYLDQWSIAKTDNGFFFQHELDTSTGKGQWFAASELN